MQRRQWIGPVAAQIGRNALALLAFWVIAFAFIQAAQYLSGRWQATDIAQLCSCILAAIGALRFRAHMAALLITGQVAFTASELTMHSAYSIRAVQGAPTHFAVMLAATLGVLFGALSVAIIVRAPTAPRAS